MKKLTLFLLLLPVLVIAQKPKEKTLLESLGANDTLIIQFSRASDFPIRNKIKFYFTDGKLFAQTQNADKMMSTEVRQKSKAFLIELEKESHKFNDRSKTCNASDGYLYFINSEFKFRIIDQSCAWFGFSKMTKELFGFE